MLNITTVDNDSTARTRFSVAYRRAENLAALDVRKAIELCVGPSLRTLEAAYTASGIELSGNDIDLRWRDYYPQGNWFMGNALELPLSGFDAAIFAPPLSRGCTGRREDSLNIDEVNPSYREFLSSEHTPRVTVLVLPGRSLSTKEDRKQFYALMKTLGPGVEAIEMKDERNRITKYVDIYIGV